jgi:hypothetical protein
LQCRGDGRRLSRQPHQQSTALSKAGLAFVLVAFFVATFIIGAAGHCPAAAATAATVAVTLAIAIAIAWCTVGLTVGFWVLLIKLNSIKTNDAFIEMSSLIIFE